ncbi:MSP domain-containing protein [Trichostrongylus colubriformis]|uniref:MSP domain-containing protein n=1 Tax=Trichostrongylus colubriformis TaxID=6319 RepID=A0AAN8IFE3_TRICO
MPYVLPTMVIPAQTPMFVGTGESRRELKSQSEKNIAFKLVFPPGSNYSATTQFGSIPPFGKTTIVLTRNKGKCPEEKMTIQYAAMAEGQTDPAASFSSGNPDGEFIGETIVRLCPIT